MKTTIYLADGAHVTINGGTDLRPALQNPDLQWITVDLDDGQIVVAVRHIVRIVFEDA